MTNTGVRLIDTHAHLDDEQFAGDFSGVIERAIAAGVERIVNVGYRPDRWRSTLALAAKFPVLAYALGLHPHHADEWSPTVRNELLALLSSEQPVALGEIGLDYYRNHSPADSQMEAFSAQLEIASEFALPVVIHHRDAEKDLMLILDQAPPDLVCVLHSFDGTAELAAFAADRDYFLGVGGLMTRAGAEDVRDVLRAAPLDRLLLESDSPYLIPADVKSRRNEPANITIVAQNLAELRGLRVDEIARTTTTNAERFFGSKLSATTSLSAGSLR